MAVWTKRCVLQECCCNRQQLKHWQTKKNIIWICLSNFPNISSELWLHNSLYGEERKNSSGAQGVKWKIIIWKFLLPAALLLIFFIIHILLINFSWTSTLKLPKMSFTVKPSIHLIYFYLSVMSSLFFLEKKKLNFESALWKTIKKMDQIYRFNTITILLLHIVIPVVFWYTNKQPRTFRLWTHKEKDLLRIWLD